jgi:SH3 domain protein
MNSYRTLKAISLRYPQLASSGIIIILLTAGFLLSAATASAAPAPGETIYVTDELRLGLYPNEQTSGRPTRNLISGDALEVLERSLMSVQVRTEDGDVGWVKTAYIVDVEPGRRRAARLDAEIAGLRSQLDELSETAQARQARITALETQLDEATSGISELPGLKADNAELRAELAASGSRIASLWAAIIAAACAIGGFIAGCYWLDRRVRKQFGGVRVY